MPPTIMPPAERQAARHDIGGEAPAAPTSARR
jgi:hypothetical protein